MANEFSTDGIARGLERASDDMKRDVARLLLPAAEQMESTLASRYPIGRTSHPGVPHMRDDMRIRRLPTQQHWLQAYRVIGPRLAFIWQNGTAARYDATRGNAYRGRMPAIAPGFFERTAIQIRANMLAQAQHVLDRPRVIPTTLGGGLI